MSNVTAATDLLTLIKAAAGTTPVVLGERRTVDTQAPEPKRPYFRVSFVSQGGATDIANRKRGVALIECYTASGVEAWALGPALTRAMGIDRNFAAPTRPNDVDTFGLASDGWKKGADPNDGGHVYCNVVYFYFD